MGVWLLDYHIEISPVLFCWDLLDFLMGASGQNSFNPFPLLPSSTKSSLSQTTTPRQLILQTHQTTDYCLNRFWNFLFLCLYSSFFFSLRYSPSVINSMLVILKFIPWDPLSVLLSDLGGWAPCSALPGLFALWFLLGFDQREILAGHRRVKGERYSGFCFFLQCL